MADLSKIASIIILKKAIIVKLLAKNARDGAIDRLDWGGCGDKARVVVHHEVVAEHEVGVGDANILIFWGKAQGFFVGGFGLFKVAKFVEELGFAEVDGGIF